MSKMVHGYVDIHTILSNERKLGGAIEAKKIKLRSGEEYSFPVITHIDFSGSVFYTLSFIDKHGEQLVVHVNDISVIESPTHKRIVHLNNEFYKNLKVEGKLKYLKRLCEVNEGAFTEIFLNEVKLIIEDIGMESVSQDIDISFLNKYGENKVFKIA